MSSIDDKIGEYIDKYFQDVYYKNRDYEVKIKKLPRKLKKKNKKLKQLSIEVKVNDYITSAEYNDIIEEVQNLNDFITCYDVTIE